MADYANLHYQVYTKINGKKKWVWHQERIPAGKALERANSLKIASNVRNIGFGKLKKVS